VSDAAKPFEGDERKGRAGEPKAVPQWVIDAAVRPAVRLVSRTFWRIRLRGVENIPASGGLIVAANHQTYFDPFWITIPIKRPVRYLAWNKALKWPLAGKVIGLLGAWPISIEKGSPTAYRLSLQWLGRGNAVMIFPEGGRATASGAMGRFKTGAARLALEAEVPVLPVTIRGGNHAWPRGQRLPRTARVEIIFHPVRHLAPRPGEDARQCAQRETDALAEVIQSAL
jgi:1-acyl-sn-glycerol-3-phosphate acyltransferase